MFNQNERAKALIAFPGSTAPCTALSTVRDIRKAIQRNLSGGNYGVYCSYESVKYRICDARTRWGQMEVKLLTSGTWVIPDGVFVEG